MEWNLVFYRTNQDGIEYLFRAILEGRYDVKNFERNKDKLINRRFHWNIAPHIVKNSCRFLWIALSLFPWSVIRNDAHVMRKSISSRETQKLCSALECMSIKKCEFFTKCLKRIDTNHFTSDDDNNWDKHKLTEFHDFVRTILWLHRICCNDKN